MSSRRVTLRLKKRPSHCTDFVGFPGGGGRRQRILINQAPPVGTVSQLRCGYISGRNPKRRTPFTVPIVNETLTTTQEISSDQTSVSSPTSISPPESNCFNTTRSLSSSQLNPKDTKLDDANSENLDDDKFILKNRPQSFINDHSGPENNDKNFADSLGSYLNVRLSSSSPNTPLMALRKKEFMELLETFKSDENAQPKFQENNESLNEDDDPKHGLNVEK